MGMEFGLNKCAQIPFGKGKFISNSAVELNIESKICKLEKKQYWQQN